MKLWLLGKIIAACDWTVIAVCKVRECAWHRQALLHFRDLNTRPVRPVRRVF